MNVNGCSNRKAMVPRDKFPSEKHKTVVCRKTAKTTGEYTVVICMTRIWCLKTFRMRSFLAIGTDVEMLLHAIRLKLFWFLLPFHFFKEEDAKMTSPRRLASMCLISWNDALIAMTTSGSKTSLWEVILNNQKKLIEMKLHIKKVRKRKEVEPYAVVDG
ncbi:hypothetical protein NECAME_06957 [Necator americanus]|uniref:Uncharacterized protein n=1 Tax=Necator americanus TaxID=51031 RepID=W2TRJ8_NECAM|nr:hypothetical protein NECAME_06957 [Necator americanus]ETN84269.1 hypothetical protein NECAME_06957 [Necator americanus]